MYTPLHARVHTAKGPASSGPGGASGAARSRRERAYLHLRTMVLNGDFPFGHRLGEEAVAEALGVSRTPVREALLRLHADRLLHRYDDGGFYVAEPDLLDIRDLYELRLSLELHGITRANFGAAPHDPEALRRIREDWLEIQRRPPEPDGSFIELDEAFHVALCRASGNVAMVETLEGVNARIRHIRMYDFLSAERIEISIVEHLAITDAVIGGELDRAARLMRDHIGASLEVVEDKAATAIARMIRGRSRRRD
ncbi:GntR family transcriptional regulator [Demequina sp.]|uniref:GntR family transcriptional regulator n=1 Tax=Demequina sp. TaxID=2050685 RepID=UPI0025F4DAE5|nr:GntR family transcriptional regulator [Demequina sp.]